MTTPLDPGPSAIEASDAHPSITSQDRWSLPKRIGFRFAFCYLGGYCICNGNATLWNFIPGNGSAIQNVFSRIFSLPAQFLAGHIFHVAPPGDKFHPTGSGDTAINWIACLLLLLASLIATALWSALDRRRPNYRTLAAWLRFVARLTVAVGMVTYGLAKVFPVQMPPPNMDSLSEPLGMHSPMSLLWDFIGVNPWYEMVCGSAELLAGLLLFYRRTALAGALLSVFVATNILLYNLAFDVPVKLYAGHLLLLSLFLILPDASALFRFFVQHQPASLDSAWAPLTQRRGYRRAIVIGEAAFAILILAQATIDNAERWLSTRPLHEVACPLCGDWRIDPVAADIPQPPESSPAHPADEVLIFSATQGSLRDSAGGKLYLQYVANRQAQTVELIPRGKSGTVYTFQSPDLKHITLTPLETKRNVGTLHLSLASPPDGYPLITRGFHWITESSYRR